MKEELQDLTTIEGVLGVFISDGPLVEVVRAPDHLTDDDLIRLATNVQKALIGAGQYGVQVKKLSFRFNTHTQISIPVEGAKRQLHILVDPAANIAFVEISAEVAREAMAQAARGQAPRARGAFLTGDIPPLPPTDEMPDSYGMSSSGELPAMTAAEEFGATSDGSGAPHKEFRGARGTSAELSVACLAEITETLASQLGPAAKVVVRRAVNRWSEQGGHSSQLPELLDRLTAKVDGPRREGIRQECAQILGIEAS